MRHVKPMRAAIWLGLVALPGCSALVGPERHDLLLEKGLTLAAQGKLEQAREHFERATRSPARAAAWANLGVVRARSGDLAGALQAYDRALRWASGTPEVHYNRGVALLRLGHLREAAQAFRRSVALRPDLAEGWHNLGVTLVRQGRAREAVGPLRRAVRLDAGSCLAWNSLGVALVRLGRVAEARQAFRRALALHPSYRSARRNLARLASLR